MLWLIGTVLVLAGAACMTIATNRGSDNSADGVLFAFGALMLLGGITIFGVRLDAV
jgi:drug/metabolite transporter (DMT)-like permease